MIAKTMCMGIAYLCRPIKALAVGMPLLLSLALGGCGSSSGGSSLMDARAEAPTRPKASGYLPVEYLPPARDQAAMASAEQAKLKKELLATRDRQAATAKAQGDTPAQPAKP
jgi:hypothetical protein